MKSLPPFVIGALLCGVGLVVVAAVAFGSLGGGSDRTVRGIVVLSSDEDGITDVVVNGDCEGDGGYSDLEEGAQVTIKDEAGNIIGTGELGPGSSESSTDLGGDPTLESLSTSVAALRTVSAELGIEHRECEFQFEIRSLPRATYYDFSIGRRGGPSYSYGELERDGWRVSLSIGDD